MPNRLITKRLGKISLAQSSEKKPFVLKITDIKSRYIYTKIKSWIKGEKVLDIGTGMGGFAAFLSDRGYSVTSIDVDDSSLFNEFPTSLYNGLDIPYADGEFDTAVLVHVLHHCSDRYRVLDEALRVSKRVIFVEDTYRNWLEWLVVSFNDAIGNGEYRTHPYNTPKEWRSVLKEKNCKVLYEESYSCFTYHILYGRYVIFVVER